MQEKIRELVARELPEHTAFDVAVSEREEFGHYSVNAALRLAGTVKRPPLELAGEIAAALLEKHGDFFARAESRAPGFVNLWLSDMAIQGAFTDILKAGRRWGAPAKAHRETIVIDYSHPNIAKPMSVAHLRSTVIGAALYNIFTFSGWKTVGDNHLGDWGKQFGVLIASYKEKIKNQKLETKKISIDELMRLYVDYTARMNEDAALEAQAREETKKLQRRDRENIKLWRAFYAVSLNEFKAVYKRLGVSFDHYLGESFYHKELQGIIDEALQRGIAEKSEGAVIISFEDMPPMVVQKSDEAFLYSTTDLAAIRYRVKKFKARRIIYVVDNGQSLHFSQLFAAARKIGFVSDEELTHVKFGLVLSADMKKLSTRAGKHISLNEVLDEAVLRAHAVVSKKRPELSEAKRKKIAEVVGIAALKFNDLSQNRQSDIAFDWDRMLNFEGKSAPYLMYTYARLKSILRKAGRVPKSAMLPVGGAEGELVLKLVAFPDVLARVRAEYFPHFLTDYLFELAEGVNGFYHREPVLRAEGGVRAARLALVSAAASVLATGLELLGVAVLEEM